MLHNGKLIQDLYQVLEVELAGSTRAVGKLGQANFTALHGKGLLVGSKVRGVAELYHRVDSACFAGSTVDRRPLTFAGPWSIMLPGTLPGGEPKQE